MKRDPRRELVRRGKRVLWKRINRPKIVPCLPVDTYTQRADAAVVAWLNDIFAYFEIDPNSPNRYELAFWPVAVKAFPNFRLLSTPNIGNPGTEAQVDKLLDKFDAYEKTRKGSRYKNFLADHAADCAACKITTDAALKGALLRARLVRKASRDGERLLVNEAMMKAYGIKQAITIVDKSAAE
jgi:hypothetical protein